jgi:hypothetical protein
MGRESSRDPPTAPRSPLTHSLTRSLLHLPSPPREGKKDKALAALDQGWAVFVGGNPDCGL